TLVGTVFAHRVFDIVPVVLLVIYVLLTAGIPGWALGSLAAAIAIGTVLFAVGIMIARRHHHHGRPLDGLGHVRRMVTMAREGLAVLRTPLGAGIAVFFQICGWLCQLLAVYTAMRAFHIHSPLPAAGVVLLLMNVVTIFPFWPGNVGLVQVAIASALVGYGVAYGNGIAYGFGLQAIEASVGIGVGLLFLAREGLSFAMLRVMPTADQADQATGDDEPNELLRPERAHVPG
ncbi:MAG TPA: lysylphosphatidylglycerol synthase transmembrane domain-containing protein, partial [Gaiellaceae bacterium]|nr:lysylphosphatidylglycerol synthase transmembrane domain-containing protein [Gaiellaceae bacterium]